MSQTIKLKRGTTTPTTSNIVSGEVAIDTSAQKLYINDAGTIKEIGGGTGSISVSDVPNLPASKITSGTFSAARIPSLDASKITSGTFAPARIPTLSQYLRSNANDTTTGNITIDKATPRILLKDNNSSSGTYPEIEFETTNNQGVKLYHNEFDGELPAAGYGLVLAESDTNTQFPNTGTLSFNVLGEMYAGGTTLSSLNKVFHDGYHPNADKLTTARTIAGSSFDGTADISINYNNLTNKPASLPANGGNADTVDNLHAASFTRADADLVTTGRYNTMYSGAGTGQLSVGRGSTQALHIVVDDNNIKLTADQDSDSNGNHGFILDRTFDGTGANDFEVRKAASTQFKLDTNANATFYGNLYVPQYIYHGGDTNTYVRFENDQISIVAGGTTKFHSSNTYLTTSSTLNGSNIGSGTVAAGRIANLAASKITSGTFADARIPNLNASKITAGTFNSARIPEFLEEKYIYNSNDSNGVFMPMVKGGLYATTSSTVTGGIKVVLPAYKSNMMFTIYVDIFEYTTGETCTFRVSGYAYNDSGATWHNCSVVAITDNNRDYTVRFYSDTANSQQYFTIGETNSTWSYPQVTLRDFWGGYSTSEAEAQGTWSISFVTSFSGTLRHTFSDNLPYADWDRLEGKPSFATVATSGSYNDLSNKPSIPSVGNGTLTVTAGTSLSGGGSFTANQSSNSSVTLNVATPSDAPGSWNDVVGWNSGLIKDTAVEIHGSGYLRAAYLNMTHGQSTRNSDSIFFSSTDSYIRKNTASGMRSSLDLYTKSEVDALIPSVPSVGNGTLTVSAGTALSGGGSFTANQSGNSTVTINHGDTSSQASVNNSGNTVIQDITLDTHGHITGITSKALSIPNSTDFVNVTSTQAISGFKRFNGNMSVADSVQHEGDSDTKIDFTTNRVRIYAGNSVKFDTNNTYLTSNSNITTGNITTYTSNGATSTAQVNVGRGGGITFYGGAQTNHSIMSRDASGTISDDIRINSYGAVNINLDSNSNNSSSADFAIGHHGGGTGTITNLFTISGETGQVKAKDGTSSAPTYSFSADTNLGLFRYGGDVLGITAGGTRRARFGSSIFLESNDVRINEYLYHNGDTNTYIRYTGDRIRMVAGGVTFMDMVEGATDYLRFNTRGVTIGSNTNPQATLTVDQSCTETPANGCGTGRDAHLKLENTNTTGSASTCIIFNAKDSGGNMRHGAGIQFKKAIAWSANGQYPGELYFWTRPQSGNQAAAQKLDKDGNAIFKGNVTAYGSLSDRRLKENIEPITDAVAKVEQLEGVTFDYKKDGRRSTGLIAQDLEEVLPEAVYTTTEVEGTEEHKAIHYGNTVGLLVNAIKEQQQTINQLTKRIEELENGNH